MDWELKWSENNRKEGLKRFQAQGKKVPALENKPVLYDDLIPVWQAFFELHNRRQIGTGINPISITAVRTWLDFYDIEEIEERHWFYKLICALDNHWLSIMFEKQDALAKKLKRKH